MKVGVFTACIGSQTDQIKPPTVLGSGVDYHAFVTAEAGAPEPWHRVQIATPECPSSTWAVQQARLIKMRPDFWLPDYDYSLWIDAAYRLDVDPLEILKEMPADADICALEHPDRTNVAQEGAELVRLGMVPEEVIVAQLKEFWTWPSEQQRLTSTGFLLRRHSAAMTHFNATWAIEFTAGGHTRDQMSFDIVAKECGLSVHYLRGHYRDNPYAKWFPNRRRRS